MQSGKRELNPHRQNDQAHKAKRVMVSRANPPLPAWPAARATNNRISQVTRPATATATRAVTGRRVYRIWRREGLKIPMKQPKRGRLWLNDGSRARAA